SLAGVNGWRVRVTRRRKMVWTSIAREPSWTSTSAPAPGTPAKDGAAYDCWGGGAYCCWGGGAYCCCGGGAEAIGGGGAKPPAAGRAPPHDCGAGVACADSASPNVTMTRQSPNITSSPDCSRALVTRSPFTVV